MSALQASSVLEGLFVLDLTRARAGPAATRQLADWGADVIRIEIPEGSQESDVLSGSRDGGDFQNLHRNKRSLALDLKTPEGLAIFKRLAAKADVIVENFRPSVKYRLGIDQDTILALNPRIIYASISGFGQTGPYADRPGFDLIAQGMSGLMSVTGEPGGTPVKCGVPVGDMAAGLIAANGVLAALIAREKTGRGQHIETSLFESALAMAVWETTEYWASGETPRALGSAHRLNAPYQAFRTSDGHITLAALTAQQWLSLCAVLGRDAMATDSRFETNAARMANRPALAHAIESALGSATTAEWVERLLAVGVPAGPIHDFAQVFADPHTQARRMIEDVEHPVAGRVHTLGFPLKMSHTPLEVRRAPPLLGEHTAEVLHELGVES
jgi:formyl-CoA transferase